MWNMPVSFLMQENMKSNTTLCILSGIFEVIKGCDFAYKADFNPEYEAVKIKKHKIWFSKVKYKIPGLNFYSHPFFIIEEYCPVIFNRLRVLEGIKKEVFLESLDPENNQKTLFSLHMEQGGSGSLFIFTEGNNFVIKVLQKSERKFFIETLLLDYLDHIEKNCESLLNRILGVFTIKIPGLAPLELILSQSLLKGNIVKYYDIKGSSYNRHVSNIDYDTFKGPFKDTDFINENERLCLEDYQRLSIKENINKDFNLLLKHEIMDYSLLVIILLNGSDKCFHDLKSNRWYRFGIIDFLGEYSFKRKAEYYLKKMRYGKNIKMCSVMKPHSYYSRIVEFITNRVF